MGLEPTTPGTTIRCSNRLSYIHRFDTKAVSECKCNTLFRSAQKKRTKNLLYDKMSVRFRVFGTFACQNPLGISLVGTVGANGKKIPKDIWIQFYKY